MNQALDPAQLASRALQGAHFLVSATGPANCPPDAGVEVAFAGRSNAGKSSALNVLVSQGSLARTSKTPGRTQLINFFRIDDDRRLVDLPGYGYAKVSNSIRVRWQQGLEDYLNTRASLVALVLVMDIRHPLTDFDQMMLDWGQGNGVPVHCLLTKADKLGRGAAGNAVLAVQREIEKHWPDASAQAFSATARTGLDEAWQRLAGWLQLTDAA